MADVPHITRDIRQLQALGFLPTPEHTAALAVSVAVGFKFGATSVADLEANRALMQSYLDNKGLIYVLGSGVLRWSGTVYYNSDTALLWSARIQIQQPPGNRKTMLSAASMLLPSTPVTLTWAAGTELQVTWAAHGFKRGSYFVISGVNDAQPEFNMIYRVDEVVDVNNVKAFTTRVPAAAPTGTPVGWRVVENFHMRGGDFDFDYPNNGAAGGDDITNVCNVLLGRIAASSVDETITRGIYKYGFHLGAAMDVKVRDVKVFGPLTGQSTSGAEGLKQYGPVRSCEVIGISGRTTDDGTSIQPEEDANFASYKWTWGDIYDVKVHNVDLHSSGMQGAAIVYCGPNYIADLIDYKNIKGHGAGGIFAVNRNVTGTNCKFGRIDVDGVHGTITQANGRAIYLVASGGTQTVGKRIHIKNVTARCDGDQIYVGQSLTCDDLDIERVTHNSISGQAVFVQNAVSLKRLRIARATSDVASAAASYLLSVTGSAKEMIVEQNAVRSAANRRLFGFSGNGNVVNLTLRGNVVESAGDRLGQMSWLAPGSVVNLFDNQCDNIIGLAFANGAGQPIDCTLNHGGNNLPNASLGYIRADKNSAGDALTIRVRGGTGNIIGNAAVLVAAVGTPQFEVYDPHLKVDVGATGFVKTVSGQMCFNTSAGGARGTLVAGRLVTCSGVAWVQMDTPANVF